MQLYYPRPPLTDLPNSVDYATDELIGKTIRQYVFPLRCISLVLTTTAGNLLRARYSQLPIACARLSTTTGSVWYHLLSQLMKAYSSLSDYAPRPRKACGVRQTRGVAVQPPVELLQSVQSRREAGVRYIAEVGGVVEDCRMG